jgi:hypothetical protein
MKRTVLVVVVAALLPLGAQVLPAQQAAPAKPEEACRAMIERSRMTDKGQMLLQRLMRSTEAPPLMDRLVHMADNLGGGDVVAGLTRMVETVERVERQGAGSTAPRAPSQ